VYDRFLGEREKERRESGAYYTPMFLADTVVSQLWEMLPAEVRSSGRFLDPACGSGIFLVRSFQRLCEHWRSMNEGGSIPWSTLLSLLSQIHGWDVNGNAVRVAVFSLYVALLEEVSPRDIRGLISRGKILPEMWGKTLACRDFFDVKPDDTGYDAIIGNPPWTSRRGTDRSSLRWCKEHGLKPPSGEDAWAFSWKAVSHAAEGGLVAFVLPAMGFLHNNAQQAIDVRDDFFRRFRVRRIINFADLRFQLFEGAIRPAALIIYERARKGCFPYHFDYWVPKADLNLRIKRIITLSSADKQALSVATVINNPLVFKQRLWMRAPEAKLFSYLSRLPKIGDLVTAFGSISRRKQDLRDQWVIGQGYQPLHKINEVGDGPAPDVSKFVGVLPDIPIEAFSRLAVSIRELRPAASSTVRRFGFEHGFTADARILVPRGVETAQSRLRAAYCDEPATFQHILQAIVVPPGEEARAKLLTALLNSRVAVWYAFHGTASFGSDRPEVSQADLLRLPFPSPTDVADEGAAERAASRLVQIIDEALERAKETFSLQTDESAILREIDRLAYAYFGLSTDEVSLVDDAVESIIPAVQPHEGHFPRLWESPDARQRALYANTLASSLRQWFDNRPIDARLVARSTDLAVLRLRINRSDEYREDQQEEITGVLENLSEHIHQPLDGNFQLMPDIRVFIDESLYLIKPMQMRYWLQLAALADADAVALDLEQNMMMPPSRSAD
jgi:hypothetical protein